MKPSKSGHDAASTDAGTKVAVIAHNGKTIEGGLPELRRELAAQGVREPMWFEVDKSRRAQKRVREAIDAGAELLVIWGGDGMVQRCIDVAAGKHVSIAVIPAGTANLLATNLKIPMTIADAVKVALHGDSRTIDVGTINGECFAVMGGAGFDGTIMEDVSSSAKERFGRVAYVRSGVKAMKARRVATDIEVNGDHWFHGPTSCVLVGNVGTVIGGLKVFEDATPDDGLLDLGVVSAEGTVQWARVLGRIVAHSEMSRSPFVRSTQAAKIDVRFAKKVPYEIDGGARGESDRLKIRVRPHAIAIRVPIGPSAIAPTQLESAP